MNEKERAYFRELLQRRRRELVEERAQSERGVEEVRAGKTDPEYEEGAQADHAEYLLFQLSNAQRVEVERIDAALERLEAGSYGECLSCGGEIETPRLFALPYTLQCAECAAAEEEARARA